MLLAFKASLLTHFRSKWDRTRGTRFQGKCHIHCTSGATLHWWRVPTVNGSWMRVNPSYTSKHNRFTHENIPPAFYTYMLCDDNSTCWVRVEFEIYRSACLVTKDTPSCNV